VTVKRRQSSYIFADGKQITTWQASWDITMARREIEEQARARRLELNGSGDATFLYFWEKIYAPLAACSTGDIPDVQRAFELADAELDGWFLANREVNPDWYDPDEFRDQTITLSDGSQITVWSKRPSVLLRRYRLDQEAEKQPALDNIRKEVFRLTYYPKLAGCSTGDVPGMEEARSQWGEDDLQAWYDAARWAIPEWFLPLEEIAERNRQEAEEAEKKRDS
jgi:hypothetical protein